MQKRRKEKRKLMKHKIERKTSIEIGGKFTLLWRELTILKLMSKD